VYLTDVKMTGVFRPRRRVVLDWDPVLKRVSAQVVVRNRSQEWFAFKVAGCILIILINCLAFYLDFLHSKSAVIYSPLSVAAALALLLQKLISD